MPASHFRTAIEDLYRPLGDQRIEPFIGAHFDAPHAQPRIVMLGVNAYVDAPDWHKVGPGSVGWFAGWYRDQSHRFDKGAAKRVRALLTALGSEASPFDDVYFTDAVKRLLRADDGKHAHQITDAHYDEYRPTWHRELDLMFSHGVPPDVILSLGEAPWPTVWQAFHPQHPREAAFRVTAFEAVWGTLPHHLNRVTLEHDGREHRLLLVRLPHPAAHGSGRSTEDILAHELFESAAEWWRAGRPAP